MVVLATQMPLTRVLPGPQAAAACVTRLSGDEIGTRGIACADVVRTKAKPTASNLIILSSPSRSRAQAKQIAFQSVFTGYTS